ncbi:PepSY domain-containing protein [Phenylobacterium sp. J367]|uniref:PepSY domain-containing protein n=1 Tax=Phenylobacterium sp. J367 TaxID=2898435 RepID=UPI002151D846|nr:PepSY domain-containing protein [Phenylobacterium sp. J367]MCR5877707.1 PepSY domain-containing protein [Phenylobacterium sp. J367]
MRIAKTFLIAALATTGLTAAAVAQTAAAPQTIGVARAVAAAEQATGGRAFEADLDTERGVLVYEIDLVKDGRPMEATIDATSGQVIRQTQPAKLRLPFGQEDLKAAQTAPRTLSETIAAVEAATKGRVTDIGLEREGGRHYYEVELAGAQDREVRVDLRTGAISPVIDD